MIDTSGYDAYRGRVLMAAAMSLAVTSQWLAGQIRRVISKPGKESRASQRAAGRARALYVPSRPGEPPRRDTGTLMKSIAAPFPTFALGRMTAIVGTGHAYGRYLELGTRKMAPRPYLRMTLDRHRTGIHRVFLREMRKRMS